MIPQDAEITIPFSKPRLCGSELNYIAQSVLSGRTAGDGPFGRAWVQVESIALRLESLLPRHPVPEEKTSQIHSWFENSTIYYDIYNL